MKNVLKNIAVLAFIIFITYFIPFLVWTIYSASVDSSIGMGDFGATLGNIMSLIFYTYVSHIFIIIMTIFFINIIEKKHDIYVSPFYIFLIVFIDVAIYIIKAISTI